MPIRDSAADLTYEDMTRLENEVNPGLLPEIGRAARGYICDLYQNFPSSIVENAGASLGLPSLSGALLDRMCRPVNKLPPVPSLPFVGGQCPGVRYQIESTVQLLLYRAPSFQNVSSLRRDTVFGPVRGLRLEGTVLLGEGATRVRAFRTLVVDANDRRPDGTFFPTTLVLETFSNEDNNGFTSVGGVSLVALDPTPVNCGNTTPRYPQVRPPLASITNNVTVNNQVNVPITIPITIIPTLVAPIGIVLRPEFNVNVGGINVEFAPDGIRFTQPDGLPPGTDLKDDPRIILPTPIVNNNSETDISVVDLTPVLDRINEVEEIIERCCDRLSPFAEPTTDEYDISVLGTGISGTYNLPSKTFRVTVEVLTSPEHRKEIFGNGNPNVLFCGWAWFDRGGGLSERLPIDAERKSYEPPSRSQGTFVFSMYTGYTAIVRAYFAKSDATP